MEWPVLPAYSYPDYCCVKSLVLHAKIQQVMRYGLPWRKKELYRQIKNDSEQAGEFMAFSTFERRLRQADFDYIECVFVKEVEGWRYIRKEPVFEPSKFSTLYDAAMKLYRQGKERLTWVK